MKIFKDGVTEEQIREALEKVDQEGMEYYFVTYGPDKDVFSDEVQDMFQKMWDLTMAVGQEMIKRNMG